MASMLDVAFDADTYRTYRQRLETIAGVPASVPESQVLRFVTKGLPATVLAQLGEGPSLARYAGEIPSNESRLSLKSSFVAFELAFILALAQAVLGCPKAAEDWLATPCGQLGGFRPADLFGHDNGAAHLTVSLIRLNAKAGDSILGSTRQ